MVAALNISGLSLRFGGVTAIAGLDLSVASGRVIGVAGPNGSGKSSLINVLTGHYASEGRIELDNRPIMHLAPPERARLGLIRTFQTPRVYARMSVRDNLRAALHSKRGLFPSRAERRREDEQVRDALSVFGIAEAADALPGRLTSFELRRLELARAHVADARVLLLDEPSAGATEREAAELERVMACHLLPGRTVLLVEHRIGFLQSLCSDLLVLEAGRKIAFGQPARVLMLPEVRSCLLGEPVDA